MLETNITHTFILHEWVSTLYYILDLHLVTGFCKTKSISCHKMNERCFFNAFKLTKLVGLQLGIATIFWAIVINQTK